MSRLRRRRYADLASYLRESGTTQVAVAADLDIPQSYVSRLAAGLKVPSPELTARLADYAHIPLDSFLRTYLARKASTKKRTRRVS